jgi:hypothetical protein
MNLSLLAKQKMTNVPFTRDLAKTGCVEDANRQGGNGKKAYAM